MSLRDEPQRLIRRQFFAKSDSRERFPVRESPPFGVPQLKPSGGGGRNRDKRIMFLATALTGKQRFRTLG